MRDVLPTVADVRAIYFKAQRKKNIIPQHANLTPKFNRHIVRLLDSIASEKRPALIEEKQEELRELLQAKKEHEDALFLQLRDDLEKRILNPPRSIRLRFREVDGRKVTVFNKTRPTLMLLDRFAALHLSRAFGVQTKGRDQCVRVSTNTFIISSRGGAARQGIIKMDLDTFYASIDHELLLAKIEGHAGVPRFVKQHVRLVLDAHARLYGDARGIPDGVPSSAVLAETYLENFDSALRGNPEVALFLRYVDDIVIICEPERIGAIAKQVDQLMRNDKLTRNELKSTQLVHPEAAETSIDYLGYKFKFEAETSKLVAVDISDAKLQRYAEAAARLSKYADGIACWASPNAVDTYLATFEYLFRPHATADAGHGVRIVTGLAYSARFMRGAEMVRPNFKKLVGLSKKEVGTRWGLVKRSARKGTTPLCGCCGVAIHRAGEILSLNDQPDVGFEVMGSIALDHSDDDLRARVGSILWN